MSILGIEEKEIVLHRFENFPVKMGVTNETIDKDIKASLEFVIGEKTGMIHISNYVAPEILYEDNHYNNVGKTWELHHKEFARFISKYNPSAVYEIGGGTGLLAKEYQNIHVIRWTILDSAPKCFEAENITHIQGLFDEKYQIEDIEKYDAIVHTHTMEHFINPYEIVKHMGEVLDEGKMMFFSVPNLKIMYEKMYTNILNFEHTYLCIEPYISYIMAKAGFKVIEKKEFLEEHSVFYAVKKEESIRLENVQIPSCYEKNKKMFTDWIDYHTELIKGINKEIKNTENVYLFGAHAFSQYLLSFGVREENIKCVLDNDLYKQGMRLYGTNFTVNNPEIIRNISNPVVILHAGVHNDEIKRQLLSINPKVRFA